MKKSYSIPALIVLASALILSFAARVESTPSQYLLLDSPLQDSLVTGYDNIFRIKNTGTRPFRNFSLEMDGGSVQRLDSLMQFRVRVNTALAGKSVKLILKERNQVLEQRSFRVVVLSNAMIPRFRKHSESKK